MKKRKKTINDASLEDRYLIALEMGKTETVEADGYFLDFDNRVITFWKGPSTDDCEDVAVFKNWTYVKKLSHADAEIDL